MHDLEGKTFLIVGASRGIGKNVAEYLTNVSGASVVLIARNKKQIVSMAEKLQGNNYAIQCDVTVSMDIQAVFQEMLLKGIKINGMVYCAGIAPLYKIEDNDENQTVETIKVNALGFLEMCKYMISSSCVNKNASIVAISSIVSDTVTNRQAVYAGSKAMLNTYVKYMAKETLGRMRVNAILPGAVRTDMLQKLCEESEGYEESLKKYYPLGIIPPEKISKLVSYLFSTDAEYITGSLFTMDGGYLLR